MFLKTALAALAAAALFAVPWAILVAVIILSVP